MYYVLLILLFIIVIAKIENSEKYQNPENVELHPSISRGSKNYIQLKERQKVLTNLLKDFIYVCDQNDIKYFAMAGTLIGILRHKEWIPWDDDIDIGMFPEDFHKLHSIYNKTILDKYELMRYGNITNYISPFIDAYKIIPLNDRNIQQALDIFIYMPVEDNPDYVNHFKPKCNKFFNHNSFCKYPYKVHLNNILPLKKGKMANLKVKIPNKPIEFLEKTDGYTNIHILPPISERKPKHDILKYIPNFIYYM